MLHYNEVLTSLGEFGTYQKRLCVFMFLIVIPNGLHQATSVFNNNTPHFRCAIPGLSNDSYTIKDPQHNSLVQAFIPWDEEDGHYSQCEIYDQAKSVFISGSQTGAPDRNRTTTTRCDSWVYYQDGAMTPVVNFNMVCDRAMYKAHLNLMVLSGLLVGSLLGGTLSDFIGRKKTLIIGNVAQGMFAFVMAFAQSIHVVMALRFLASTTGTMSFMAVFVLLAEVVGVSRRSIATMASMLGWSVGLLVLALVQFLVRDWRTAQLIQTLPFLSYVVFWWLIEESPRWLLTKNRLNEAKIVIAKIARINKVSLHQELEVMGDSANTKLRDDVVQEEDFCDDDDTASSKSNEMKFWQICTDPKIVIRFIILCFSWITINMVYYGLMLGVGDLIEGDIYINFTLQALMEIIGHVVCVAILEKVDRKCILCSSMIVTGVATLGIGIINITQESILWLSIALFCLGKLCITVAFSMIFIITAELMPTKIRNSGLGFCSFVARFSGIVIPYIVSASLLIPGPLGMAFPVLIFGAFSLASGFSAISLPETRNAELPETFGDNHKTKSMVKA